MKAQFNSPWALSQRQELDLALEELILASEAMIDLRFNSKGELEDDPHELFKTLNNLYKAIKKAKANT